MKRKLSLSLEGMEVSEESFVGEYKIVGLKMVVNVGIEVVRLPEDDDEIKLLESRIVCDVSLLSKQGLIVVIEIEGGDYVNLSGEMVGKIKNDWDKAFKLYPNVLPLKKMEMYRSLKEEVGMYSVNMWYLKGGTRGRVHQEHDFREIHTQIAGIGIMQKYRQQDYQTLYESVYMSPGYTHFAFYDGNREYPWHSYDAVTDCVWMAIERRV